MAEEVMCSMYLIYVCIYRCKGMEICGVLSCHGVSSDYMRFII